MPFESCACKAGDRATKTNRGPGPEARGPGPGPGARGPGLGPGARGRGPGPGARARGPGPGARGLGPSKPKGHLGPGPGAWKPGPGARGPGPGPGAQGPGPGPGARIRGPGPRMAQGLGPGARGPRPGARVPYHPKIQTSMEISFLVNKHNTIRRPLRNEGVQGVLQITEDIFQILQNLQMLENEAILALFLSFFNCFIGLLLQNSKRAEKIH